MEDNSFLGDRGYIKCIKCIICIICCVYVSYLYILSDMSSLELTDVFSYKLADSPSHVVEITDTLPENSSTKLNDNLEDIKTTGNVDDNPEDRNECLFCYNPPNDPIISPCCRKVFCRVCLNRYVLDKMCPHCPICQRLFYIATPFSIYFDTFYSDNRCGCCQWMRYLVYPLAWLEFLWNTRKRGNQITYNPGI